MKKAVITGVVLACLLAFGSLPSASSLKGPIGGQPDGGKIIPVPKPPNPAPPEEKPPRADAGGPYTVRAGRRTKLDGSGSRDPGGMIVNYEWRIVHDPTGGARIIDIGVFSSPYAVFEAPKNISGDVVVVVELTVTDEEGLKGSDTAKVLVEGMRGRGNRKPVPRYRYRPRDPEPRERILFDATWSTDPDGRIVSYSWRFGDNETGKGRVVEHRYSKAGTYSATLTVTDDDGATSSVSKRISVGASNKPPVARFYYWPRNPSVNRCVFFSASTSFDPDGHIAGYSWMFGDGTTERGKFVTHSYTDPGLYPVRLTVADDDGARGSSTRTIRVGKYLPWFPPIYLLR
ncbi:hypothetical protein AKJ40_00910 [candidate division MSBL1 archaeon SCGC-AAA259M10]|uniref:PKD domain-containing protein n=1 Tax=candidate division MSBL1 archaeon SCGC-AAA259M10 TaxID=1698270 RepID=A0A133V2N5_9EURY|nr:hypothetical protein AKJ40_00910 [candidate division MSBL1 archaeon SCGC-AAA259M10]